MIYLVSNQLTLFNSDSYQRITIDKSIELLNTLEVVGVDSETQGLDPHKGTLLLLQLGCKEFQIVIDCTTIDISAYKEFLESDRLFLFWNARFDLKWLFNYGIVPKRVWDGFLGEKLLWLGYPTVLSPESWQRIKEPRYDYVPANGTKKPYYIIYMNLKKAGEMYCDIELDKTVRGKILYMGITKEVIIYGANDVKWLEDIKNKQDIELSKKGLLKAMDLECRFILPLAYLEYCGVRIDTTKWKQKMDNDQKQLDTTIEKMNKWLIENYPDSEYIYKDLQGDLFAENPFDVNPKVSVNWNSAKQVIPIFKHFDINVVLEGKDSINEKVIAPQSDKCSLIPLYLEYKGLVKLVSTYGKNLLDQINPNTGRLYTNFNPIGTDTVRISSGGKYTENGKEKKYINFLNFPSDKLTRSCFIAEKGNKWISIDYSGQESFIMADISNDEAIIHELTYGDKDLHTLTAKIVYDYIPKDMPAKEVKEKFHDERQKSKGYEFAFNYSGNASTIKKNFGLTDEEANRIYNSYMSGFNGLKKYQEFRRKEWWRLGYIDLNPKIGYKAFIYDWEYLKKVQEDTKEPGFWEHYKSMKNDSNSYTVTKVRDYFKRRADSDRQSVNYPIQHTGSLCYKVSMITFFEYLRRHNLLFKVLITITPYDEINCEAPEAIAEEVASKLHEIMVKAGACFVNKVKLEAEISREKDGSLPTYWIH